jgi:hypothetical protein
VRNNGINFASCAPNKKPPISVNKINKRPWEDLQPYHLRKKTAGTSKSANKGAKTGTVLIRDTEEAMHLAARMYQNTKDVILLGEHRNGKRVDDTAKKKKKA